MRGRHRARGERCKGGCELGCDVLRTGGSVWWVVGFPTPSPKGGVRCPVLGDRPKCLFGCGWPETTATSRPRVDALVSRPGLVEPCRSRSVVDPSFFCPYGQCTLGLFPEPGVGRRLGYRDPHPPPLLGRRDRVSLFYRFTSCCSFLTSGPSRSRVLSLMLSSVIQG